MWSNLKSDEEKSSLLKLVEYLKQTETVEHTYFIYATVYSFSSKQEFKLKFKHFHTSGDGRVFDTVNTL